MQKRRAGFPRVGDLPMTLVSGDAALVADLSTHLGITNRVIQHNRGMTAVCRNTKNVSPGMIVLVTEKIRDEIFIGLRKLDRSFFLGGPRSHALPLHELFEALSVNRQAALTCHY